MKKHYPWVVAALFFFANTQSALAAKSTRTDKPVGLIIGGNAEPAPSIASVSLGINITSFLRIQGGAGTYNNTVANVPRDLANYTIVPVAWGTVVMVQAMVKPFVYALAWFGDVLGQSLSNGKVKTHLRYKEYWPYPGFNSFKFKRLDAKSIMTLGGSTKLFVPGWDLSPFVGGGFSYIETSNHPFDLPDRKNIFYYNVGLDYQNKSGLNIGIGANFCPALSDKPLCGGFGGLGFYF